MSNSQLIIALVGWAILFYLHNRTLRKGEISRLKDSLTKEIKDLFTWIEKSSNKSYSALELEEELAGKVTLIEFLISQFNNYASSTLIDPDCLTKVRNIDTAKIISNEKFYQEDKLIQYDIIEQIENAYYEYTFSTNHLKSFWLNHKYDFKVIISTLAALVLYALFFKLF
ncbi:MAG: hypothetical protein VX100_02370 [Pseudomonadota bacterium]|nr:hypothetical protein [Pseudomonadota bacterium]